MPYTSIDLADLDQGLIDRLDQPAFYDSTDRADAINAAISALAALTGVWKLREVVELMPNGPYVALPATMMSAVRVACNGKPLAQATLTGLDALVSTWEGETVTTGGGVPTRPFVWAPAGLYMIAIWPAVVAQGTFSLEVDGYRRPPVLASQGSYLEIESGQVSTLLDCAAHLLALDQGGSMLTSSVAGLKGFLEAAGDLNGKIKATAVYREVMGYDRSRADRPLVLPSSVPPPPAPGEGGAGGAG